MQDEDSSKDTNTETSSLLDHLRRLGPSCGTTYRPWDRTDNAITNISELHEKQQLMDLIVQNATQFPHKLRPAIAEAKVAAEERMGYNHFESNVQITEAEHFHYVFFRAVAFFFMGRPILPALGRREANVQDEIEQAMRVWQGPDSSVDTHDEIEIAMRVYPVLLNVLNTMERRFVGKLYTLPYSLMTAIEALPFIPLLLDLCAEYSEKILSSMNMSGISFGNDENGDDLQFPIDLVDLSCELLNNTCEKRRYGKDPTIQLHEESLATFLYLKDKGFVNNKDDVVRILRRFVSRQTFGLRDLNQSITFFERRLQHLIEWEPNVLNVAVSRDTSVVVDCLCKIECTITEEEQRRLCEIVLEQGMLHFPNQLLGFGFHGCNFKRICTAFGTKVVQEAMNDKMKYALVQSSCKKKNVIQNWVFKAATEEAISLDGLYILIRFDPSMVKTEKEEQRSKNGQQIQKD